jgi:hypothetical protein
MARVPAELLPRDILGSMIPYDDLVAALSQWRARQGLPVSTMGTSGSGGTPAPGSGPHGQPGSGPNAASSSRPGMAAAAHEVDDAEVLEDDAYENDGGDYGKDEVEPTAIGTAPERPTETDMGGGGREDW